MKKRKLLVVPHSSSIYVKVRLREVAKFLSDFYEVFILSWSEPENRKFLSRLRAGFKDLFQKELFYEENKLKVIKMRILHWPLKLAQSFNRGVIERLISKLEIDVLINGLHYFFPAPDKKRYSYQHIFDLNDLPTEDQISFLEKQIKTAHIVTTCSLSLKDYLKEKFNIEAYYIPNGADLKKFKEIDKRKVKEIKEKYNLINKFVIGYIGYIGDWLDLDFTLEFFKRIKKDSPKAVLFFVGEGYKLRQKDIIFTGGIPEEKIIPYFFVPDLFILPSKKTPFQDSAFHIKIIEYTASHKPIIATDLKELKRLDFPNLFLADLNIEDWLELFNKACSLIWNKEWDKLILEYDWQVIKDRYIKIIESFYA